MASKGCEGIVISVVINGVVKKVWEYKTLIDHTHDVIDVEYEAVSCNTMDETTQQALPARTD